MTHLIIDGVAVRLIWVSGLVNEEGHPCDGTVDADPQAEHPALCLDDSLRGLSLINTFIHEVIHRCQPSLSEEAVAQMADDITHGLAVLGVLENPNGICREYLTRGS